MEILKYDDNKGLALSDSRKITVSTSKKQNKTYRSFQINMPLAYINLLEKHNTLMEKEYKTKTQFYLVEQHPQHYMIQEETDGIEKATTINFPVNYKKRTVALTLPKHEMKYIKAYDELINAVDVINEQIEKENESIEKENESIEKDDDKKDLKLTFKVYPITVKLILDFTINEETNTIDTSFHITEIETKITDELKDHIIKQNNYMCPEYLKTLLTDWNVEYLLNYEKAEQKEIQYMIENMKLDQDKLQKLMGIVKDEIKASNDELSEIDVKSITLDDLVPNQSQFKNTIAAAIRLKMLNDLSENYFLMTAAIEQTEQVNNRMGENNPVAEKVSSINETNIKQYIKNINDIIESDDFKHLDLLLTLKGQKK